MEAVTLAYLRKRAWVCERVPNVIHSIFFKQKPPRVTSRHFLFLLVFYFFSNFFASGMRSGAERQIDENVPAMTPTSITSAKLRVAAAPK